MGINYRFEFYYRLEQLETVLTELNKIHVSDAEETTFILPDKREIVMPFSSYYSPNDPKVIDLSLVGYSRGCASIVLLTPKDDIIQKYVSDRINGLRKQYPDNPIFFRTETPYAEIGNIDLHFQLGKIYAEVSLVAVTGDMSRLFQNSPTIQKRMHEFAQATDSIAAGLDVEDYANGLYSLSNFGEPLSATEALTIHSIYSDFYQDENANPPSVIPKSRLGKVLDFISRFRRGWRPD